MANKVGTQLLMNTRSKERAQTLAIVRGEAQAEMFRTLVDRALPLLEAEHADDVNVLLSRLRSIGADTASAVDTLCKSKINFETVREMSDAQLKRVLGV